MISMISELAGPGLAIVFALLGAVCFAGAAVLQHRAVRPPRRGPTGPARCRCAACARSPAGPAGSPGSRSPAAAPTLHAIALVLAPLSVVQPVGVLAVPIAVVLTAVRTDRRPGAGRGRRRAGLRRRRRHVRRHRGGHRGQHARHPAGPR